MKNHLKIVRKTIFFAWERVISCDPFLKKIVKYFDAQNFPCFFFEKYLQIFGWRDLNILTYLNVFYLLVEKWPHFLEDWFRPRCNFSGIRYVEYVNFEV